MARPKGTGINDWLELKCMANLVIDGIAANPWQASKYARGSRKGASAITDSIRRRLCRKYKANQASLEAAARETMRFRPSLLRRVAEAEIETALRAWVSYEGECQSNERKLNTLLQRNPEIAEIVRDGYIGDLPLAGLLPEILNSLANQWIDFEE